MLNKFIIITAVIGLFFFGFQSAATAADGDVDPFYLTGVGFDDAVRDMAIQPDGKLIVVGNFLSIAGVPQRRIARIKSDGNLDETFLIGSGADNGTINSVKVLSSGKILIAGSFTSFNGRPSNRIALINTSGSFDPSFNSGSGFNGEVLTTTVQPDGKLLIGGSFGSYNGVVRLGIIRLLQNGSPDLSFVSPLDENYGQTVYTIAVQSDNKIIFGGSFAVEIGSSFLENIMRVDSNGSLDSSFLAGTGANGSIASIAIQPDDKILIGGGFSSFNGIAKNRFARLLSNGSLDTAFSAANINTVLKILVQTDGKILLAGSFQSSSSRLIRINADGTADPSFIAVRMEPTVNTILLQPDNKIIVGGRISSFATLEGAAPAGFYRLNSDGTRDPSYVLRTGYIAGDPRKIYIQSDGKILVTSTVGTVGGLPRPGLARLNTDGTVDSGFNPNVTGPILISLLPDNKMLVIGRLGDNTFNLYRVSSDGTVELTSILTLSGSNYRTEISDLVMQSDGKILLVGDFNVINNINRRGFVRLNADGSVDQTFDSNLPFDSAWLNFVKILPDGKILIAGKASTINSRLTYVFRLNSNGTSDSTFFAPTIGPGALSGPGIPGTLTDLLVQEDGKIVITGFYNTINAVPSRNVSRLNSDGTLDTSFPSPALTGTFGTTVNSVLRQKDGKYIIAGDFETVNGVSRNSIVRLNPDASVDLSFKVPFSSGSTTVILTVVQQADGNLVIAGSFNNINNFQRRYVARLLNTPKSAFSDFDGDGRADLAVFRPASGVWYLQQSANGFAGVQFGQNSDVIVPADYDGDGKTDVAVYRNGVWYLQRSQLGFSGTQFGAAGDIPMPADFEGDGRADLAVFRPSNGTWYVQGSRIGFYGVQFGQNGDKPVAADYDGDGKADVAVFRSGIWYIQRSQLGFTGINFGQAGDLATPADYDGDGKTDVAVFRPSTGTWYLQQSTAGFTGIQFGANGDAPSAADYDGDGKTDLGVFRAGVWYLQRSTTGFTGISFGNADDLPTPNAFVR